ncbi:MAG: CoA pyrophosphatase [Bacteroidetes bacterium]|nr:CoA pyrophosphatase [Bacteroidota bacterium]
MFAKFIEQLKVRFQKPLPGEDAQFLMASITRQRIQHIDPFIYNPRKSAVLILLFPMEEGIHTLLIQRPVYDGVHSDQVSFPGGKFEETDIDLSHTALRETFEEVGAPSNDIEIIGKLTDLYINPSNFLVSPFIGFVSKQPDFIMDTYEVQKIISVDLFSLNDKGIRSEKTITHSNGYKIKTPYYEIDGLTVWGATAMMISELNVFVEEAKLGLHLF